MRQQNNVKGQYCNWESDIAKPREDIVVKGLKRIGYVSQYPVKESAKGRNTDNIVESSTISGQGIA